MKPYESFDHTADVGLRIRGKDLKGLFVHAAEGLFDLMAEPKKGAKPAGATPRVRPAVGKYRGLPLQIKISASSQEDLLVAWLRELIYLSSARRMVFCGFKIKRMAVGTRRAVPLQIQAEIFGEKMDPQKHILKKEVKAVTYHGLSLKRKKNGWVAEVIFDV